MTKTVIYIDFPERWDIYGNKYTEETASLKKGFINDIALNGDR